MVRSVFGRRVLSVVACVLVLQGTVLPAGAGLAFAATPARVLPLPVARGSGTPESSLARLETLISQELGKRSGLQVASLRELAAPAGGAKAKESREALEEGKRLLGELRFDAAAQALQRSIDGALSEVGTADFAQVLEAYVSLGVAQLRMGNDEKAAATLLQVARLEPSYTLPEGRYPPVFVRELEKAKKRAEKLPRGALEIDGPPGANVYVNGRGLGMVPVREEGLGQGTHYVMLDGTRGERWGQAVELRSGVARVQGAFGPVGAQAAGDKVAAVGPWLDVNAQTKVAQWARAQNADGVLVTALTRKGDGSLLFAAALFVPAKGGFVLLPKSTVDQALSSAGLEVSRVVDAAEKALRDGTGTQASLPLDLSQTQGETPVAQALDSDEVELVTPRSAVRPEDAVAQADGAAGTRAFDKPSRLVGNESDFAPLPGTVEKGGVAWWVWALGGVGLAAAAAGTYYGVSQASKPVTGTVSASW